MGEFADIAPWHAALITKSILVQVAFFFSWWWRWLVPTTCKQQRD
jgi:hypothetical protein